MARRNFRSRINRFTIALIPSVRSLHKPARTTSFLTGSVLLIFAVTYGSLGLCYSAVTQTVTAAWADAWDPETPSVAGHHRLVVTPPRDTRGMQVEPFQTTTLHESVSEVRLANGRIFTEAERWMRATGPEFDADLFALPAAAAFHFQPDVHITRWSRVRVACIAYLVRDFCTKMDFPVPDGYAEQFWNFLCFLDESDWLDDHSDRISALLQPLRCEMKLDKYGLQTHMPQYMSRGCLCFKTFRGQSHGQVRRS